MTDVRLFDYDLPEELIAQHPAAVRDASRLLVVNRATGKTEDRRFSDLYDYINAGDVLVFNDSRVIKARLIGEKEDTGARVEVFLVRRLDESILDENRPCETDETGRPEVWEALAKPAKRLREGVSVVFDKELRAEVLSKTDDGFVRIRFHCEGVFTEVLEHLGHVPLPPYINRADDETDAIRYQTVYAKASGSVAAPTAGLHFTEKMLDRLRAKGVETVFITLHVGLGTFRPVVGDTIEDHKMHEERYIISEDARKRINLAKAEGRRIICVGTTAVRAIESAGVWNHEGGRYIPEHECDGATNLYIYPGGRKFFMTDGIITNFHLPRSTLLMLICAFYDREKTLAVYKEAVEKKYRFFSYGDAMLII